MKVKRIATCAQTVAGGAQSHEELLTSGSVFSSCCLPCSRSQHMATRAMMCLIQFYSWFTYLFLITVLLLSWLSSRKNKMPLSNKEELKTFYLIYSECYKLFFFFFLAGTDTNFLFWLKKKMACQSS